MRLIFLLILIYIGPFEINAFQVQTRRDSTSRDSLNFSFRLSPDDESAESFSKHINDSTLLQFSSGISIINSLRGQVPNMDISANAYNATGNVRIGNTSLIMDGIPFHQSLNRLLPLNTFEYRSVTVYSNPNILTAIDGITDGAILLESKSGAGFDKPTFEVNSYTTYGKFDYAQLDPIWYFANSVAYMQDFGKVNTRISYTLNAPNDSYKYKNPLNHTINSNTEIKITSRFSAQLITNTNFLKVREHEAGSLVSAVEGQKQDFTNASLLFRYQFADWLYATSRVNYSIENYQAIFKGQATVNRTQRDNRQIGNLFLNFDRIIGRFSTRAYVGLQNTQQNYHAELNSSSVGNMNYQAEMSSTAFSAGSSIAFNNLLAVNANFRRSDYSSLPSGNNRRNNYSIGFSFLPSSLIRWEPLSFVKVRATYGIRYPWAFINYPDELSTANSLIDIEARSYTEIGGDLSFFNSRLKGTVNYFINKVNSENNWSGGSTGSSVIFYNVADRKTSGTEIIFSGVPVITNTLKYETTIIWSTCNIEVVSNQPGNPTNFLGSSFPDWRTSFYNSLTWKNLSINVLVDANKGGAYYTSIGNMPSLVDGSFIKLRDVSVGYWIPLSATNKLGLSKLWLSTSFRNPVMYLPNDFDSETSVFTAFAPQKTISFNVYASF